jgi:hypothetical protein
MLSAKIVSGKLPDIKAEWAKLMLKPHAGDESREPIDDGWWPQ